MKQSTYQIWVLQENLEHFVQIKEALSEIGDVVSFSNLEEMIATYEKQQTPELLITEYQLRELTFIEAVAQLNQTHFLEKVPTIMISEMNNSKTIRGLFQSGIKDYFITPVSSTEIQIKSENILQNAYLSTPSTHYVRHGKTLITGLTRKEIQIFQYFQSKSCQTATRNELQSYCWPKQTMTGQTLNVHIHNMRKKLHRFGLNICAQKQGVWKLQEHVKESTASTVV